MLSNAKPICLSLCDVPTVYSWKQSYYECLCYLGAKINSCIEEINNFQDNYKQYTDEQINILKEYLLKKNSEVYTYIDNISLDLNTKISQLNNDIKELETELNIKISEKEAELKKIISDLDDKVEQNKGTIYNYIARELEKVYKYIETYYCENIKVYNPVTGLYQSITETIASLYNNLRFFAITCIEFDNSLITCEEFDSLLMTASEFDIYAKERIYKDKLYYMFDPFTGEWVFYQNVIIKLAELHMSSPITAKEFDLLDLTVTGFSEKTITAWNFDNEAKKYLIQ